MKILNKIFGKKVKPEFVPISAVFAEVTRQERINIKLSTEVTKKNQRFLQGVAEIFSIRHQATVGDTYEVDYSFDIDYLNGVNERLHTVLNMIDRKDVVIERVSLAEVTTGICLIKELFDKLVILQDKIPKVKGNSNKG